MYSPQVYFPINQREQAAQRSAEVLLAIDVYRKLAIAVAEALNLAQQPKAEGTQDVNDHRAHTAVLIDGSRGTGKSSVLVNIEKFLEQYEPALHARVHILKPLDPTLLESTDDLFLNVIVAGLVCDEKIQVARQACPDKGNFFHEQLQRLGNTLDRLESQRELRGLDKLRAFMGNRHLAQEVHQVFEAALELLGKDLLVLPIDDVDTSLERAFANLEVIRKYLVSPFVLPVVSGDLELYEDLTWRSFHGKLLKESEAESSAAMERAKDLAREYHRKVLPLQYRIEMPEVLHYLRATSIGFYDANRQPIAMFTMAHFYRWLETLLNDRTNGTENSYLAPPVKNVRSLAQLVYSLQEHIPALAQIISDESLAVEQLRRQVVIPVKASVIASFESAYATAAVNTDKSANEAARREAYRAFSAAAEPAPVHQLLNTLAVASKRLFRKYCQLAAEGGPAYLTLTAQEDWLESQALSDSGESRSVLDTVLFQPMVHRSPSLRHFVASAGTKTWQPVLRDRAPDEWLARLPAETLVPYPSPEPGYALNMAKVSFKDPRAAFVAALLLHRNFYTTNKRATLACCGRVFELVVASFVKDVTSGDIAAILERSPFHSLAAVASTKTQLIAAGDDGEPSEDDPIPEADAEDLAPHAVQIERLSLEINEWRRRHELPGHVPASWFVYNVMNKVFNQAALFNAPKPPGANPDSKVLDYLQKLAPKIFNGIWAAFGSFEKGSLFGLPPIIAQVNVGEGKAFKNSELYNRNIAPFVGSRTGADSFGQATRAYTHMMDDHPLRELMQTFESDAPEVVGGAREAEPAPKAAKTRRKRELTSPLLAYLNAKLGTKYTVFRRNWILAKLKKSPDRRQIADEVTARFANDRYYNSFMELSSPVIKSI